MVTGLADREELLHVLDSRAFYRHDPLLVLLKDRLQMTAFGVVLATGLFGLFVQLLLPALLGVRYKLDDIAASLLQTLVILPMGMYLYVRFPGWLAGLFESLDRNGVVRAARSETDDPLEASYRRAAAVSSSVTWSILGGLSVLLYAVYRLFAAVPADSTNAFPEGIRVSMRIMLLLLYAPPLYGGVVTISRLISGMMVSGQLFQACELNINPLHLDRCGGLSYVGRMLTGGVLVATVLGAAAAGVIIAQSAAMVQSSDAAQKAALAPQVAAPLFLRAETIALGLLYLVLTPLLFRYWLWMPHQAMLRARERAQQPLADGFQQVFAPPAAVGTTDLVKSRTDQMQEIKRQYDFVLEAFPVWPLPAPTMKRLVATASLPTISSILAALFPHLPAVIIALLKAFS